MLRYLYSFDVVELLLLIGGQGLLKDSSSLTREASAHGLAIIGPRSTRSLLLALSDQVRTIANLQVHCHCY